jgi:hypothetical protein
MFMVMSNELTTPKVLFCPAENSGSHSASGSRHHAGRGFRTPKLPAMAPAGYQNDYNLSYFVGVDANSFIPNMLLAGDHNLGT